MNWLIRFAFRLTFGKSRQKSIKSVWGKRPRPWPSELKAGEEFGNVLIRSASLCPLAWPCQINSARAFVCLRGFISGLDSFPLQALHHQTEGVATRWLNKHITQLPITQIHLAPSCQRASHSSAASAGEVRLVCVCVRVGVFNFTHRHHPSSAALCRPSTQVRWNDAEWQTPGAIARAEGRRDGRPSGTFDRGFIESSQGGAQDPGQGVKSL